MQQANHPDAVKTDELMFASPEQEPSPATTPGDSGKSWKVMIIDDDDSIHTLSNLVLDQFSFMGFGLEVVHGYSGADARRLMKEHPDTAVMLLDVVMENDTAGLEVVKYVREELGNKSLQIILRTGQPGVAPEETIVREYEINDYKNKSELTAQKLYTALITSLRAFRDMTEIQSFIANDEHLKNLIEEHAPDEQTSENEYRASISRFLQEYTSLGLMKKKILEIVNHFSTILYLKDCEGQYLLVNNEFEKLFHLGADKVNGKRDHDIFPAALAEQISKNDKQALNNQMPIQYFEKLTRNNQEQSYITIKFPVYNKQNKPLGVCGISMPLIEGDADITQ